ncbi:MAG: hypothetical protein HQ570_01415 [Candidatus Omnitrophica bacterium]|nr:hypothetical protein [Candidatus Omnitrophota bacterium]
MIAKIIGLIWVVWGILIFVKPEILRKKLQTKGSKKLKKNLFLLTLFLSITLIIASFKADGLLPKILLVLGIIGIFKAFIFLKSKASDKLIAFSSNLSLSVYRVGGVFYVILGLYMMKFL